MEKTKNNIRPDALMEGERGGGIIRLTSARIHSNRGSRGFTGSKSRSEPSGCTVCQERKQIGSAGDFVCVAERQKRRGDGKGDMTTNRHQKKRALVASATSGWRALAFPRVAQAAAAGIRRRQAVLSSSRARVAKARGPAAVRAEQQDARTLKGGRGGTRRQQPPAGGLDGQARLASSLGVFLVFIYFSVIVRFVCRRVWHTLFERMRVEMVASARTRAVDGWPALRREPPRRQSDQSEHPETRMTTETGGISGEAASANWPDTASDIARFPSAH